MSILFIKRKLSFLVVGSIRVNGFLNVLHKQIIIIIENVDPIGP